jgi:YD repeat-containing protein
VAFLRGRIILMSMFMMTIMGLWHWSQVTAQPIPEIAACDDTEFMMRQNATPTQWLRGGGVLMPETSTEGTLGTQDLGDVWTLNITEGLNFTIQFEQLPGNIPLEFALFRGLRVESVYRPIENSTPYTLALPNFGIYTLVVRMQHPSQLANIASETYQITANFIGNTNLASALEPVRDAGRVTQMVEGVALNDARNLETYTFANTTELRYHINSISAFSFVNADLSNMLFEPLGQLVLGSWVDEILLVGGDLSLQGDKLFYLEGYGFQTVLNNTAFENITDSFGTRFSTDWQDIVGVWMMRDCLGVRYQNGRTLTIGVDEQTAGRSLLAFGDNDNTLNVYGCTEYFLQFNGLARESQTERQSLCMEWGDGEETGVLANTRTAFENRLLSTRLIGDRDLTLSGRFIELTPLDIPPTGAVFPVRVEINDTTTLLLDWQDLSAFQLQNESASFSFIGDDQRDGKTTTRNAQDLTRFTALGGVIEMVYADSSRRMILSEAEGYAEWFIPTATPLFDGESYKSTARPNEVGFAPRNNNNVGGECRTLSQLPELNCAPNGTINPANGNYWLSFTDLSAYHPMMNFALTRSYNTANSTRDGVFGRGWTSNLPLDYSAPYVETTLSRTVDYSQALTGYSVGLNVAWASSGVVTYTTPSGSQHLFIKRTTDNQDVYVSQQMVGWTLWREGDTALEWLLSDWTLRYEDGYTATFDKAGRLTNYGYPDAGYLVRIERDAGNINGLANQTITLFDNDQRNLTLTFNENGRIVRAELRDNTQDGCTLGTCFVTEYSYQGDLLTEVRYPNGQVARYAYDDNGRLVAYHDLNAPIAPHMGLSYSDANEVNGVYFIAESDNSVPNPALRYQTLSVELVNQRRIATLIDYNGNQRETTFEVRDGELLTQLGRSYLILSASNPLSNTNDPLTDQPQFYTWSNTALRLETIPGRNFEDITFTDNGRLDGITGNTPNTILSFFSQEVVSLPLPLELLNEINYADGTRISYDYDDNGAMTSTTTRQGMTYTLTWDAGKVIGVSRADGVSWQLRYNHRHYIREIQQFSGQENDSGYRVAYVWDALGRLIQIDDSLLGVYTLSYDYQPESTRITITTPANASQSVTFDAQGRLLENTLVDTTGTMVRQTSYAYHLSGTDPLLRLSSITQHTQSERLSTFFRYDNLVSLLDPAGLVTFANEDGINGTMTTLTDAYGRRSYQIVDGLGRLRLITDGLHLTRYDYGLPEDGQLRANNGIGITQTDYLGSQLIATTAYDFDTNWQLARVNRQEGANGQTVYEGEWRFFVGFDLQNEVTTRLRFMESDGTGLGIIDWSQDSGAPNYTNGIPNQVTVQRREQGRGINSNVSATYDTLGRVNSVSQNVQGQISTTHITYCNLAQGATQLIRVTASQAVACGESGDLALTYDAHQRLIAVQDAHGVRTYTYEYDPANGGTIATISNGQTQSVFSYNVAGDIVRWQDENGLVWDYSVDELGRLTQITSETQDASWSFEYNALGLVTRQVDGLGRGFAYTYNPRGQLLSEQSLQTGDLTTYTYNALGMLSSVVSPLGAVTSYTYDTTGADPTRLLEIVSPNGRERFAWDNDNNTLRHIDPRGNLSTFQYDSLGVLWQAQLPEGRAHNLQWDAMGQLNAWTLSEDTDTRQLNIQYAPNENTYTINEQQLGDTWRWRLDFTANDALESVSNATNIPLNFDYDAFGRLTQVTDNSETALWQVSYENDTLQVSTWDGMMTRYRFDALYRVLSQEQGEQARQMQVLNNGEGEQAFVFEGADPAVIILDSGESSGVPRAVVFTNGRRTEYLYDVEQRLTAINTEICLEAPFTPLSTTLTANNSPCLTSDNIYRENLRYSYSPTGNPIRLVDAEQNTENLTYDVNGNLIAYQNIDGKTYTYTYDGLNRLTRITSIAGFDLIFDYTLDRISGICQASSTPTVRYDQCTEQGGQIATYNYDTLGRLTEVNYSGGGNIGLDYAANGGSKPTQIGETTLSYAENGLGWLAQVGNEAIVLNSLKRLTQAGELRFSYDDLGRMVRLEQGDNALMIEYASDNLSYTITDSNTDAQFTVGVNANGTLANMTDGEDTIFSVVGWRQDPSGALQLGFLWDDNVVAFTINRNREVLRVEYTEPFLQFDYALSPNGNVQRETISSDVVLTLNGITQEFGLLETISTVGYDQNNKPLTVRVNDRNTDEIYYQVAYVYTPCGQLAQESRDYLNDVQMTLQYTYGDGIGCPKQLQSRTVTLSDAQNTTPITLTYTYEYDNGNLSLVSNNNQQCVRYTYDDLGRLASVVRDGEQTDYTYDIFNRPLTLGNRTLMYLGNDTTPFRIQTADDVRYTLTTHEDLALFSSTQNSTITPLIEDGQGQVVGTRPLNTDPIEQPIWLFDPLERLIQVNPPTLIADEPCALFERLPIPQELQPFNNQVWDNQNNLMFNDGRAYSTLDGIYLQPSTISAQGNVYDDSETLPMPPIAYRRSEWNGLEHFQTALATQNRTQTLTSQAIWLAYQPRSLNSASTQWATDLSTPRLQLRDTLAGMYSLPTWLMQGYNRPFPTPNTQGILEVYQNSAPALMNNATPILDFSAPIWSHTHDFMPTPSAQPLALLASWQTNPIPATYQNYLVWAWQAPSMQVLDALQVPSANLLQSAPADVLAYLPRPLNTQQFTSTLALLQALQALPSMHTEDFVGAVLADALPQAPNFPILSNAEWRNQYLNADPLGLEMWFNLPDITDLPSNPLSLWQP